MNSTEPAVCEVCGTTVPGDAPGGSCPRCLLAQGLGDSSDEQEMRDRRSDVLPVDRIRELFPALDNIELLGQGGMGTVYRARQPKLNRTVALKILSRAPDGDPAFAERFLREAQALAHLNHPGIVALYDFGETDRMCWFLMEYVDGPDLRSRMRRGAFTVQEAVDVVASVCEALVYAHGRGVVHRDIKPANVLIGADGQVKLADFGLVKGVDGNSGPGLTVSGGGVGTPYYMAPEQRAGGARADHRADIYAVGVLLYELLTGDLPLGNFDPPSSRSVMDPQLDAVVFKALKTDPADRFETIDAMRDALIRVSPDAPPPTGPRRGWRSATRGLPWVMLLVFLAITGLWVAFRIRPALLPADAVAFEGNYYKVIFDNVSWHQARRACERLGGHLAIVTSAAENEFIASLSRSHVWLGASDAAHEGDWAWLDGTPLTYTNWDRGEPNNAAQTHASGDGEDFLHLSKYGMWNDLANVSLIARGYVCEWDGADVEHTPAAQTPDELHAALRRANPSYNGKAYFTLREGRIIGAVLANTDVRDLSPLRGLPLRTLDVSSENVTDLSPLSNMPLEGLHLIRSKVVDLSPLRGLRLLDLLLEGTEVDDLSPLRGMPLRRLDISHSRVADLSPLRGMPLRELHMNRAPVQDLAALKGLPLRVIGMLDVPVRDLRPLAGCMTLESIAVSTNGLDISCLRALPALNRINNQDAEAFWKAWRP